MTSISPATPASDASSSTRPSSPMRVPWLVIAVSLLALPASYGLSLTSAMDDSRLVLAAGIVFCSAVVPLTYLLSAPRLPSATRRDPYFYIFTVFAFTSAIDLLLALCIDGRASLLLFYLREGEVYLSTAHGLWINAWDGSFHYACYLLLTAALLRPDHSDACARFRHVGLLWAGSILNSMVVLFVGSAVGTHAEHIKPSYLLNIPYALFPAVFLARVLRARPAAAARSSTSAHKRAWLWLLDLSLLSLLFVCACVCVVRALVSLRSPLPLAAWYGRAVEAHLLDATAYPTLQMLNYAYGLLPFLCWAAVHVWSGPLSAEGGSGAEPSEATARFRDWSVFAVGAMLQGTFSYVGAALHQGGAFQYKQWMPQSMQTQPLAAFVAVNTLLLVTPMLVCARMHMQPQSAQTKRSARVKAQ